MNKATTTNVFYLKKTTSSECDNKKQFGISKEVIREFFGVPEIGNTHVHFKGGVSGVDFLAEIQTATDPRLGNAGIREFLEKEGGVETGDYILFTKLGDKSFSVKVIKQNTEEYMCYSKLFISNMDKHAAVFTDRGNEDFGSSIPFTQTPTQIIFYGVPGSGKSHKIDKITKDLPEEQTIRVVFHPEYTNADFVGQILPTLNQKTGTVEYKFSPGPFAQILRRAYLNPSKKYYLVVEEINRGNAAAIFGDLFQLLDRIGKGKREIMSGNVYEEGWSSYFINNDYINWYIREFADSTQYEDVESCVTIPEENKNEAENYKKYAKINIGELTFISNTGIRLPPNLSILASMNTSDQNVFTLDNAFQRRWDMELVPNNCTDSAQMNAKITVAEQTITWGNFQSKINEIIGNVANESGFSSMEDKRLGCWFIKNENENVDIKNFANKVLKYLWDDAFKFNRTDIFIDGIKNFEDLKQKFESDGFKIFNNVDFETKKDSESLSNENQSKESTEN